MEQFSLSPQNFKIQFVVLMEQTTTIFLSAQLKQTHQIRIFINAFKVPEYFSLERFQISSKGPHVILNLKPDEVPSYITNREKKLGRDSLNIRVAFTAKYNTSP